MSDSSLIVVPGEEIVGEAGFLRGHGTYAEASTLVSSLAGVVERVNRLITVRPPHSRYSGEVGDVIVGRVRSVGSKQWRVDVGARQDAVLQLSAINLEGGTLRRRTLEDQLSMRSYYSEADVLSAEVHSVMGDGSLSLHARSAKYGLLTNGVLVCVPPGLMRRVKQHFVTLPPHVGCDAILGLNGYIWITETHKDAGDSALLAETAAAPSASSAAAAAAGGSSGAALLAVTVDPVTGRAVSSHEAAPAQLSEDAAAAAGVVEAVERRKAAAAERIVGIEGRQRVARAHNAICALRSAGIGISPDTISDVVADSLAVGIAPAAMAHPAALDAITETARARVRALSAAVVAPGGA